MTAKTFEKRNYSITLLLCLALGSFGAHRFYTGYIWIGIAQIILILLNGIGVIWVLIDLMAIATNNYKDSKGQSLEGSETTLGKVLRTFVIIFFGLGILGVIAALVMPSIIS